MHIRLVWPAGELTGEIDVERAPGNLAAVLPFTSTARRWGDEVYFEAPCAATLADDAVEVVPPGAICFWVEGQSLAIPFGPTPVSRGDECRLVTRVNVIGRIEGDARALATVTDGDRIEVLPAEA